MKTILLKTVCLLSLMLILSCSNDDDSCTPVACQNGGISNTACGCNCPEGFTGNDCSIAVPPSRIMLSKITIKQFPPSFNSQDWDPDAIGNFRKADIYIKLSGPEGLLIDTSLNAFQDADYNVPHSYTLANPLEISAVDELFLMRLYNENIGDDQLMTATSFYFYSTNQPLLSTLTYDDPNGFSFGFEVTYEW